MDARAWDARYADTDLLWSATPNRFVEHECADLTPGTAVDLAAGEGRNAIWLAGLGWDVTAVDFSGVAVGRGSRLPGADGVTWVVAEVTTWLPSAPVDLVVVAYLQLPRARQRGAVQHAASMLAPGGTLVWVAHDRSNLDEGTGGPQDPDVLPTSRTLLADLGTAGVDLHVERAGRVTRTVVEPGHGAEAGATAYDCLVRVRRRG